MPGEYNSIEDLLSRWGDKNRLASEKRRKGNKDQDKGRKEEVKVMQILIDDEVWRTLHDGHVDMQTM